jgi:hypothetical protein
MGPWGTAIFSDDLASDVRDDWRELIAAGLSVQAATDRILVQYHEELQDAEVRGVFWLALALTQHRAGRLQHHVLQQALTVIEDGSDLARWGDDQFHRRRRSSVLAKARHELQSPQPGPKPIRKRYRSQCDWEVGEVVAYRLRSRDWVALVVVAHHTDEGGTAPVVRMLDWRGPAKPTGDAIRHVGLRVPRRQHGSAYVAPSQFMIGALSAREIPADRIERLGVRISPPPTEQTHTVILWRGLDAYLARSFDLH